MRKTLSGKNMLKNFLKEHAYRLSQISSYGSNITIHPLRNIVDVCSQHAEKQWVEGLRKKYRVVIYNDVLETLK